MVCRVTGVLAPPPPDARDAGAATALRDAGVATALSSAHEGVDVDRWVGWARAQLAGGAGSEELEKRLVVELGAVVGTSAATRATAEIVRRAAASEGIDQSRAAASEAFGGTPRVARRMAFDE